MLRRKASSEPSQSRLIRSGWIEPECFLCVREEWPRNTDIWCKTSMTSCLIQRKRVRLRRKKLLKTCRICATNTPALGSSSSKLREAKTCICGWPKLQEDHPSSFRSRASRHLSSWGWLGTVWKEVDLCSLLIHPSAPPLRRRINTCSWWKKSSLSLSALLVTIQSLSLSLTISSASHIMMVVYGSETTR